MQGANQQNFDQEAFERVFLGQSNSSPTMLPFDSSGQGQHDPNQIAEISQPSEDNINMVDVDPEEDVINVEAEREPEPLVRESSQSSAALSEVQPSEVNIVLQDLEMLVAPLWQPKSQCFVSRDEALSHLIAYPFDRRYCISHICQTYSCYQYQFVQYVSYSLIWPNKILKTLN